MPPAFRHALWMAICAFASAPAALPVKVWVVLADKGPGRPAPVPGASAAARVYENLPLYAPHLEALARAGFSADAALKWQNRVSGRVEAARLPALRALPCVAAVEPMARRKPRPAPVPSRVPPAWPHAKRAAGSEYGISAELFDSLGISHLHRWMKAAGMEPGKGVRVAVVDADFHLGSPAFADLKPRIRDQWDFPGKRARAVDDSLFDSHGGQSLSLIGGNAPGTMAGAAPSADFLLYRAEVNETETYAEEDYVAAAIERAVDSGAQVINVSLGYRYDFDGQPDIPYAQFDGRTRPASLAALGAARRGVVVAVSMGNEADAHPSEPSLGTPADADSILSVGIANRSRVRCSYSSTGPAADGRLKPEVATLGLLGECAVGVADTEANPAGTVRYSGTSFAAPVVAAAAALLRQLRPEATAEQVRQALMLTAVRAGSPDTALGHGIIDVPAAARRLGVPIPAGLVPKARTRLVAGGGDGPIFMAWDRGEAPPAVELADVRGRRVPISVIQAGGALALLPDRKLPRGVYVAHLP